MRILHLFHQVTTFNRKMKNDKKQFAVLVLIAVHICASVFMQYSHQHIFYGRSDGHQTIQNHSCGAIEIHRSLDDCHQCLRCLRDSTSNAILEFLSTVPDACVQPIVESEIIRILAMGMHFPEPDRGPPSFSA
ncbi:MAG: hypothetical protein Q8P51_07555 [Ignavibacteria bacterium]|nr:hypothetical protein [Ignavibacteria bacterium]